MTVTHKNDIKQNYSIKKALPIMLGKASFND